MSRATHAALEQATTPLLTSNGTPARRNAYLPRDRHGTAHYTHGDDSSSDGGDGYDSQSDEAASSDGDHEQPVLDGELLQDEVTRLQQELSVTRDRLNQTKTELAFQQSRRPNDYDDAYSTQQLQEPPDLP